MVDRSARVGAGVRGWRRRALVGTVAVAAQLLAPACDLFKNEDPAEGAGGAASVTDERTLYYQLSGFSDQGWALTNEDNLKQVEKLAVIASTMVGFGKGLQFERFAPFEPSQLKEKGWHVLSFEQGLQPASIPAPAPTATSEPGASPPGSAAPHATAAPHSTTAPGSKAAPRGTTAPKATASPQTSATAAAATAAPGGGEKSDVLTIKLEWLSPEGELRRETVRVERASERPPSRDAFDQLFSGYVTAVAADQKRAAEAEKRAQKAAAAAAKKGKKKKKKSKSDGGW